MAIYVFNVDKVEIHNQKADTNHSDSDWLSFIVTVANPITKNVQTFPAGTHHIGSIIHTGDTLTGPFTSDPIAAGDSDVVTINYLIMNLGSSNTEDQFAQAVKVTDKVVGVVGPIAGTAIGLFFGDPAAGFKIGQEIAKGFDTVIRTLSDVFDFLGIHFGPANCNGEVLHDTLTFQPNELKQAVDQSASREHTGPQENSRCGMAPHSKVTFSLHHFSLANFPAQKHAGNPVLIQSRFGRQGNFELLTPLATGGLAAYFRVNDGPALPWGGPTIFGTELGHVDAVTMIQSNFGSPGNLEVIARVGDRLKFLFRDSGPEFKWNGPFPFIADGVEISGVSGNPVLLQSRFGRQGNFELLVPLAHGGLAFFARDNDAPGLPWHGPIIFGSDRYDGVTMIQSNFGSPGNLEVIARVGDRLKFLFRDSGPEFKWNGPFPFIADGVEVSGISENPVLLQSRFGRQGNFELLVPLAHGGLAFFARDNDAPGLPWHGPVIFGSDRYDGVTMIQSNFGSPGNLEAIVRVGERLAFFFRDSGPTFLWNGPFFL